MLDRPVAFTPYEVAAEAIKQWLDGSGAMHAARSKKLHSNRKMEAWDIELDHQIVGRQRIQISILSSFPETPPQVHFDKALCLVWPHVEETGRFCHGVNPSPDDYLAPTVVLDEVLQRLSEFWVNTHDAVWIAKEFHTERLSYWHRFCDQQRKAMGSAAPEDARVVLTPITEPTEGRLVAYFVKSHKVRSELLLAAPLDADPHLIAVRHRWNVGSLMRGHSLFIPMAPDVHWAPGFWPTDFFGLAELADRLTGTSGYLTDWIESKASEKGQMFLVILVESNVSYGYMITPPIVNRVSPPGVIPIALTRVDADWMLARDHQLSMLHKRRNARVLLLGCGSLGSPVAELLARAGIGELHIVDKEMLEPENCARHLLGANSIGLGKAHQVAKRLEELVPGIRVMPHWALIGSWVPMACKPGDFDLVVDCTGESSLRCMLSHYRTVAVGDCPLVHTWMEPFCAAAHAVHIAPGDCWPDDDPVTKVNVAQWRDDGLISLPACGAGFHPYGAADAWQAAGFMVERILAILDGQVTSSIVWSWVRSSAFFDSLPACIEYGPLVPNSTSTFDATQVSRALGKVLADA